MSSSLHHMVSLLFWFLILGGCLYMMKHDFTQTCSESYREDIHFMFNCYLIETGVIFVFTALHCTRGVLC